MFYKINLFETSYVILVLKHCNINNNYIKVHIVLIFDSMI